MKREQLAAELELKREQMYEEIALKREMGFIGATSVGVSTSRVAPGGAPG